MGLSRDFIVDQLVRVVNGDAWHGPSLADALDGVDAAMAARRPLPNGHSIYELTHHVGAWAHEVACRLNGRDPQMPERGDFPRRITRLGAAKWSETLTRMGEAQASLVAAVRAFDESRLGERVGSLYSGPLGTGMTYQGMLLGLVQHNAYHAGQIVLLKRG